MSVFNVAWWGIDFVLVCVLLKNEGFGTPEPSTYVWSGLALDTCGDRRTVEQDSAAQDA